MKNQSNVCTCASFFTVRGVHKEGCPCYQSNVCAGCGKCTARSDVQTGEQCVAKYDCDCHHPYNQDTSLSKCCGVPYALSVSTKWGRRVLCSHCGKPRDNKVDTSLSAIRAAGPTAAAQTTEDMKRYDSKETLIEDAVKEIESKITDHVFDGSCCYNDNEGGKGHAECRYPYNPGRENPSGKQCLKLKSEHKDLRQTFSDLYEKAYAEGETHDQETQFEKQLREEERAESEEDTIVKLWIDVGKKEGYIAALAEVERWGRARIDYESSHMKEFIDALRTKLSDKK